MNDPIIIRGMGGVQAPVACATSTKLVFAGTRNNRSCVVLQAYGSPVYFKTVNRGGSDPVPSSTDYFFPLPAGSSVILVLGIAIDIYAQSTGNVSGFEGL